MGERVATIIIEPRLLVREALVSLMASHSYDVVCGVASASDIDNSLLVAGARKLVIIGALPAADVAEAANSVRKLWPETKIVLLFEHASPADLQMLLASGIDGCIPLFASPGTLVGALQQIIVRNLRVLVLGIAACSSMQRATGWQEESDELDLGTNSLARSTVNKAASRSAFALPSARPQVAEVMSKEVRTGVSDGATSIRNFHSLSDREEQILKGLIKGHSNKVIARKCAVTEATVKVHMKSILRKIRVANRTQAAIWALENGYCSDDLRNQAAAGTAAPCAPKDRRAEANISTVIGMGAD
jgi:two-component system nitrate/nitrite response regulator NarL